MAGSTCRCLKYSYHDPLKVIYGALRLNIGGILYPSRRKTYLSALDAVNWMYCLQKWTQTHICNPKSYSLWLWRLKFHFNFWKLFVNSSDGPETFIFGSVPNFLGCKIFRFILKILRHLQGSLIWLRGFLYLLCSLDKIVPFMLLFLTDMNCRNTILALGSFLDTFQKIADAATNTKG